MALGRPQIFSDNLRVAINSVTVGASADMSLAHVAAYSSLPLPSNPKDTKNKVSEVPTPASTPAASMRRQSFAAALLRKLFAASCRTCFCFLRRRFSPGGQRWQNWHLYPALARALDRKGPKGAFRTRLQLVRCWKSHGLQSPKWCVADPSEGQGITRESSLSRHSNHAICFLVYTVICTCIL